MAPAIILDWSMSSIFLEILAIKSMSDGNQLVQMRRSRKKRIVPKNSWTTYCPQWTTKCLKGVEIYQLEDICAYPGESPDELVDCLCTLTDRCNFPSEEEKEHNVQYRFVRALDDKGLVKKLLALDLKATTAKMLEVCCTHIAISDNLDAMGLSDPKSVSAVKQQGKQHHHGHKQSNGNQHQCSNCTKSHPLGQASCSAKDATCNKCGKVEHWKPRCR